MRQMAVMVGGAGFFPGAVYPPVEAHRFMPKTPSLSEALRSGDKAAFTALYDRHAAMVYGVAKRILGNGTQAEDVAQSVFLQLWTKPAAFHGGNFAAWVARVARNAALDVLRSSAVRTREPEMPLDLPADADVNEEVFLRLRSDAIGRALAALPADQRSAIEEAYFGRAGIG